MPEWRENQIDQAWMHEIRVMQNKHFICDNESRISDTKYRSKDESAVHKYTEYGTYATHTMLDTKYDIDTTY